MSQRLQLSLALLWSSLAALAVFVLTNHYYAVDARYLTIIVFALFIAFAVNNSGRKARPELRSLVGAVLVLGIVLSVPVVLRTYWDDRAALAEMRSRNGLVTEALSHHHVDALLGDYWRVLPVRDGNMAVNTAVIPLSNCTQERDVLASHAWQLPLNHHSFAYLLSLDKGLTDYPQCSLKQVAEAYGRPNASVVIAGTLSNPKELLLFYDHGINKFKQPQPAPLQVQSSIVAPIPLDQLPYTTCNVPTIMNVVAHEDDDLLFLNPDLLHDIKSGDCIRTIYVTAGDAGNGHFYWLNREQGSEAAYSTLLGSDVVWAQRTIELGTNEYASLENPVGYSKLSLIFLHLPDGNLKGDGFRATNDESLQKLSDGIMPEIHAVDGESSYTHDELVAALTKLMHLYQPAEVHTQSTYASASFPDHSDHIAVSGLVREAHDRYQHEQFNDAVAIPIKFYRGYSVRELPPNISDGDLQLKVVAFLRYAKFDGGVCQSVALCDRTATYGAYLQRQYQYAQ